MCLKGVSHALSGAKMDYKLYYQYSHVHSRAPFPGARNFLSV
jgi:hypothetical protein